MSDRKRKNNARRKAVRNYQREHGVSYKEALRAVGDPETSKMQLWHLVAGYEDDGEPVMLSMDGVCGPDVLWISGPTGSVKFLELFVLAAQYCRMGARVVSCASRPDEPAGYWTFYRDELNRFEYITPEQLEAAVDELAASAPAAGADPVPQVLLVDDFAISGSPAEINFERLAGLNVVVLMGMQPDLFARAEMLWKVHAASRIEVDLLPAQLVRVGEGDGGHYKEFRRLFTPGRVGESMMVLQHGAEAAEAYRNTGLAVPPAEDFEALRDEWPGDVEVGPHGLALGNTAAQKKQAFQDSMRITFLDTTNWPRVDSVDLPWESAAAEKKDPVHKEPGE
ncbi:hypothetical protein [Mycobacteroides chelonae]|uniref:hypothetical protein n=1 Tax=Mycobacteroides chelonae TaxID=1774 RepID=UPI0008A87181|nr:hypothetical protein [Mycobacteroides chelonae]OHU12823.1 hypothetical protein BKG75_17580 [Mycobacteroides chelonae]